MVGVRELSRIMGARKLSRITPRGPCYFERGRGFDRIAPFMLVVAA